MKWLLIEHNANNGKFNMDFDVRLARHCKEDEFYLRFYRWAPFTISLGANQSEEDLNLKKIEEDGLGVVKRPTGGRAILHAEELTYSVVFPASAGYSGSEIYNAVSGALTMGLKYYNPIFNELETEKLQPDFRALKNEPSGIVCFNSTAKHEIKFHGKKLVGSAQRKFKNSILQHGSVLVGKYHRRLVEYLNLSDESKKELAGEMASKTIEIETILNEKVDYEKLQSSILKGFEKYFNVNFVHVNSALVTDSVS